MFYSASDLLPGRKTPPAPAKKHDGGSQRPEPAAHRPPAKDAEQYFQTVGQTERPLGLRYTLLREAGGALVESTPGTVFHSGDLIRLSVMGNQRSYVYVVSRGSSGVWSPLFPNAASAQRSNEIVPGRAYQIPGGPGEYFRFDKEPGEERIFILLSRQPVTDLDALVRGLAGEQRPMPTLQADNRWNDSTIAELRGVVQRDLVFTKVDEPPAAAGVHAEHAIYVVNRKSALGSGVVADVILEHQ